MRKCRESGAWDLVEVKSTTSVKGYHIDDMALQRHAFAGAGYNIRQSILMHIDNQYVKNGPLDVQKLFHLEDCTADVEAQLAVVRQYLEPLKAALEAGLLPVVFGDVVFDRARGGTILSTEDLFAHLGGELHPARILLAGLEPGVWADYPDCTHLVDVITPANLDSVAPAIGGSAATDVTGGMSSKMRASLDWVREFPDLEVFIFSGGEPEMVARALGGERVGTVVRED